MKKFLLTVFFIISTAGNVYAADIGSAVNSAVERYESDVDIDEVNAEELSTALTDYFAKNINAGLISNDLQVFDNDNNGLYDTLKINYLYTESENKEFIRFVEDNENRIANSFNDLTNEEKAKEIYKYFCKNFKYDDELHYDLRHLYKKNSGTCCSLSIAFKRIMDICDIPCKIVVSTDGNHEWNKVFINNEWQNIDIVYGISLYETGFPNAEMRGYLLSDEKLKKLGYEFTD